VSFLQAPKDAEQVSIRLAVLESSVQRPQGYLAERSPQPLEEVASVPPSIAAEYAGKEFYAYQFAALPDGTHYLVVLNEDKSIKFLNRVEPNMWWYARIYRAPGESGAKPELLREGLQSPGNDVTFPIELPLPGLGTTRVTRLRTEVGYNISGNLNGKPQVFSGRGPALQVTGAQIYQGGKLTLTVTAPTLFTLTPDTQVSLQFQPLQPGLPEHAAFGKITDFLTLGAARFVITDLAPDFSSATLALVEGSLERTLKQQLEIGSRMPPFSQVDLATRHSVTREEVLTKARSASGVVFVFGDLAPAGGRFGARMLPPPGRGQTTALPLPPGEVVEQLGVELRPKPLVVLVTRQIGLDFLYEDLRNKTPDYVLLTDFADPLQTTFRPPQSNPGGWYGPQYPVRSEEPSLRQLFNLPTQTLSIVVFDQQGKVLYVKADAGSAFLPSLVEARSVVVSGQK
jgi:hypothetical protein